MRVQNLHSASSWMRHTSPVRTYFSHMEKDVSQLVYTDSTSLRAGCLPCPLHCCAPPSLSLPSSDHQLPVHCTGPRDWSPESASSAPWSAAPTLTYSPPCCGSSVAPYCEWSSNKRKIRSTSRNSEVSTCTHLKTWKWSCDNQNST